MATLHFICGKAGAGKTTLARELGRTLPAVVIEWIAALGFEIRSLEDFLKASSKCRGLIGPLASELLRLGVSVVFDFADSECLANLHRRNDEKPSGVFWGHVTDELFHAVTASFAPPQPEEGFRILAKV